MTRTEYLLQMYSKLREATIQTGKMAAEPTFNPERWKVINEAIFEAGIARAGFVMSVNGAIIAQDIENEPIEVDHKLEFAKWLHDHGKLVSSAKVKDATLVDQESN